MKPRRSVDRGAFSDEPRASIDIDRDEVLCEDRKRALDDLDGGHEHDSHDRALETEESEPGTEEDHRAAEVVAIKTASAAMKRIESGVNMTGMVRMDGANALAAVGMGSDKLASDFMLHRVPSRTGLLSDMVKVASFGDLKNAGTGSLSDLTRANVSSPKKGGLSKSADEARGRI